MDFDLNEHQLQFVNGMISHIRNGEFGCYCLEAPAGTGKSFSCKTLSFNFSKNFKCESKKCGCNQGSFIIAPTHKAKNVLVKSGNYKATTIHRFLRATHDYDMYGNLIFSYAPVPLRNHLIFIDECSMVGDDHYKIFIENYSKDNWIVFCGDSLQLPPIKLSDPQSLLDDCEIEEESLTTGESTLSKTFSTANRYTLTKNMRTLDPLSAITLSNARNSIENGKLPETIITTGIPDVLNRFRSSDPSKTIVLAYTNSRVNSYNLIIRTELFLNDPTEVLKQFYLDELLVFTGFRKIETTVYNTSDIIKVTKLEQETIYIQHFKCNCMKLKATKKCFDCGISGKHTDGYDIEFWKITDDNDIIWYIPYGELDKRNFAKIKKHYKKFCITVKKSLEWHIYFDFINLYDANLKYSYSSTVHKAQGSEWNTVFVDRSNICFSVKDDTSLKLRAYYTAISRMKENVYELSYNSHTVNEIVTTTLNCGKYEGHSFDYVLKHDSGYCKWVLKQEIKTGLLKPFYTWLCLRNL